jgi:hypothetical protein
MASRLSNDRDLNCECYYIGLLYAETGKGLHIPPHDYRFVAVRCIAVFASALPPYFSTEMLIAIRILQHIYSSPCGFAATG